MSAPEPMTTEARVAETLAGARCQDVHHADAYVDPWCHACRSWAQTTTRALAPILDAARAEELREAADEVHREARFQFEQELRRAKHGYASDSLSKVERILRDRAHRIDPERKTP